MMKADDDDGCDSSKKEKAALLLLTDDDDDDEVPSSGAQGVVISSSSTLSSQTTWLDTWTAILTSPRYVTALKTGQYVSCVQLALALFAQEFFESNLSDSNDMDHDVTSYRAEQVLFGVAVALPVLLWHLPVFLGVLSSCPATVRRAVGAAFGRQVLAEGAFLAASVALIVLAVVLSLPNQDHDEDENNDVFHWAVSVPGAMLAVNYYFLMGSVWGSYKTVLVQLRPDTNKNNRVNINAPTELAAAWAAACAQHAAVVAAAPRGAVAVWFRLMRRFPGSSAVAWISLICYTSCLPLQGLTVGYITQTIAEATPESSFVELFTPGFYFLLASAGMAVFLWSMKLGFAAFNARVEDCYRLEMTRRVCAVGGHHHLAATMDPGDLSSRYARDVALVANFIDKNKLFTSSGILASSFGVLFSVDWRMGFFFLVSCPALITMLAGKPGAAHKAGTLAAAKLQSRFQNCIQLRRTMDLYNAGNYVYDKSVDAMREDVRKIGHAKWVAAHFVSAVHATGLLYTSLVSLAFILYSIPRARENPTETVNDLSVAVVILSQLKSPFSQIGQGVEHWLSIVPALVRLDHFSQESSKDGNNNNDDDKGNKSKRDKREKAPDTIPESTVDIKKSLELNDICFQYTNSGPQVLNGVNATLETGKYSCIVGGSGAGKSTLLNILTRELTPSDGSIRLDGQGLVDDGKGQMTSRYREQIAIVFQSATFFDGTIADNIRLGNTTATDQEVAIAAERAQCTFIKDLPDGLDTKLGDGFSLSGGQGQRVCLARALCRNPRILLLDESTSALDPHTEQEAVKTFIDLAHKENVAVVSVTHRLDTTDSADKVIVLKDGVVAEDGLPADLYARKGLYYDMRVNKNDTVVRSSDDSKDKSKGKSNDMENPWILAYLSFTPWHDYHSHDT